MSSPTQRPIETTQPSIEPVTLADAKSQVEIASASTAHDALLERLISEARQAIEDDTGIVAGERTITESFTSWPATWIELHRRPVSAITSIKYIDTAGVPQTFGAANYVLDASRVRPAIRLAYNASWPSIRGDESGITVTYVAGYSTRAAMPEAVKQAVLLRVAENFDDRTGANDQTNSANGRKSAYERLIMRLMRSSYP